MSNAAILCDSIYRNPQDWQIAWELKNGKRTGRFRLLNERGETDLMWPDWWLGDSDPEGQGDAET